MSRKCGRCNKDCNNRCNRCLKIFYCSRKCQKQDWENHKKNCNVTMSQGVCVLNQNSEKIIKWDEIEKSIKEIVKIMDKDPIKRETLKMILFSNMITYMRQNKVLDFSDIEIKIRKIKPDPPYYLTTRSIYEFFPAYDKSKYYIGNHFEEELETEDIVQSFTGYHPPCWNSENNLKKLKNAGTLMYRINK